MPVVYCLELRRIRVPRGKLFPRKIITKLNCRLDTAVIKAEVRTGQ
jgi:hypothetical protein